MSETERGREKKVIKIHVNFSQGNRFFFSDAGDEKQHVAGFGGGSRAPACDALVVSDKDRHRSLSPCHAHPAGAYTHLQGRASLHLVIV